MVTHFQVTCRDGRLSQHSLNLGKIFSKSLSSTLEFLHSAKASKSPKRTQEQQLVRAIGLPNKIPTTARFQYHVMILYDRLFE
jgi:hypothetical protein